MLEADAAKTLMQALSQMSFVIIINNNTLHARYEKKERLRGAGIGNLLLVSICIAQSCVKFKFLEGTHQGVIIRGPIENEDVVRLVLACVDDDNAFLESSKRCISKDLILCRIITSFPFFRTMIAIYIVITI